MSYANLLSLEFTATIPTQTIEMKIADRVSQYAMPEKRINLGDGVTVRLAVMGDSPNAAQSTDGGSELQRTLETWMPTIVVECNGCQVWRWKYSTPNNAQSAFKRLLKAYRLNTVHSTAQLMKLMSESIYHSEYHSVIE